MASIVVTGDTSGSITLSAPAVAGSNTLTLPANTGTIITTASSGQSIPKAALPTGSVLQVVQATYSTQVQISSTSYQDTGLTASITPTSSSSKILVIVSQVCNIVILSNISFNSSNNLVRGSTQVYEQDIALGMQAGTGSAGLIYNGSIVSMSYLDSPNTTSSTTYKTQSKISTTASSAYVRFQDAGSDSTITLLEIAA
jgi:hypothetical protein